MGEPTSTIVVEGLPELLRKLEPKHLLEGPVKTLLTKAALFTERQARAGAPRDTAALQRSIVHDVQPLQARVYSSLIYANVMEFGRGKGKRMPPPDALRGWIRRKGLDIAPFVLARAIARRGIKGRFFMKAAAAKTKKDELPRLVNAARKDIEKVWGR